MRQFTFGKKTYRELQLLFSCLAFQNPCELLNIKNVINSQGLVMIKARWYQSLHCSVSRICLPSFSKQKLLWASSHAADTPMINFDYHQFAKGGKTEKLENLLRPQLELHWEDFGIFTKGENVSPR